jgi:hypothetical protein
MTRLTRPEPQPHNQIAGTAEAQYSRALARQPSALERFIEKRAEIFRQAFLPLLGPDIARIATDVSIVVCQEMLRGR